MRLGFLTKRGWAENPTLHSSVLERFQTRVWPFLSHVASAGCKKGKAFSAQVHYEVGSQLPCHQANTAVQGSLTLWLAAAMSL